MDKCIIKMESNNNLKEVDVKLYWLLFRWCN